MAVCPFAAHKLIAPGSSDPRIAPRVAILHVDAGNASSLYDFFKNRSGGIESHFHIRKDGVIEQYRDTGWQADANNLANDFAVSIETQGFGAGEWTPAQLASIKRLLLWLNKVHGIPLTKCETWNGSGIGYHTLFGSPSQWTPVAKSCPGPDRIKQFHSVIVPWLTEARKGVLVRHRVATYNAGHRRNPNKVRAEVARLAKNHDVLLLQEVQEYHPELRSIEGFRLRGLGENVILVRDGLKVSNTRTVQVTSTGWVTKKGKLTKPERTTYATVDGIEYSSWHFPPSVQSRFQRTRMARRWGAYRDMGSHFKLAERAVAGGDWNVHARSDKGKVYAFPKNLIARVKARRVRPHEATHGRREIDYFAVRGVRTSTARVLRGFGSDHKPVSVTVSFRKSL